MQTTHAKTESPEKAAEVLGTVVMTAWSIGIGVVGFMLLLGAYYAMVVQSTSLLVACCFLLFLPLILTAVFFVFHVVDMSTRLEALPVGAVQPAAFMGLERTVSVESQP
jgi:hypothetical protein